MKKLNNKITIAERGGLMIEALAMLGLIAVVTPTMYKKSAERTMEVEDINTATSVRTYMNAAEAYMAANYTDIMKATENNLDEDGMAVMDVDVSEDLLPYLPYKYSESGELYNYNNPKFRIVRSGDNLTAFALFPAKVEDGIGQERTVRIASLIGANGGYVSEADSSNRSAHGVGGVWNLDNDTYQKVFKEHAEGSSGLDDSSYKYSLVTASSNSIGAGVGGAGNLDDTEDLKRIKKDGEEWRNAMRTDLYMGAGPEAASDANQADNNFNSIYNVNQLIIGATGSQDAAAIADPYGHATDQQLHEYGKNTPIKTTTTVDGEVQTSNTYEFKKAKIGLYLNGSGGDGKGDGNAYIKGALLAAGNRLWASDKTLRYTGENLIFDGKNFSIGRHKNSESGYILQGDASEEGKSKLDIMSGKANFAVKVYEAGGLGNYTIKDDNGADVKSAHVLINTNDKKYTGVNKPQYKENPDFGVDVTGNMVVEGLLAAGQLDTQKLRSATLEVGSKNIDDQYKWMNVDKDGVHVHQPVEDTANGGTTALQGTQIEARNNLITMRVGANNKIDEVSGDGDLLKPNTGNKSVDSQMVMNTEGIAQQVGAGKTIAMASPNVGVNVTDKSVNIGNVTQAQNQNSAPNVGVSGSRIGDSYDSNTQKYDINVGSGADINVNQGNMKISNAKGHSVFTVSGKNEVNDIVIKDLSVALNDGKLNYVIAGHGNTIFTNSPGENGAVNARYLAMQDVIGSTPDTHAAVNIVRGIADGSGANASGGIVYVDMYADSTHAAPSASDSQKFVTSSTSGNNPNMVMKKGSVYIRRGLIDVMPDTEQVSKGTYVNDENGNVINEYSNTPSERSADEGSGVIRASRLVANNINTDASGNGVLVKVPNLYYNGTPDSVGLKDYNGDNVKRYDTYMVNPAYTSVMNDIKLVSRGGARLSDILPTFITKGIYVATNSRGESEFHKENGLIWLDEDHLKLVKTGNRIHLNAEKSTSSSYSDPASPIIGIVPAPQCPPGYVKVIQTTPKDFRIAEAGRLRRPSSNGVTPDALKMDVDSFANPSVGNTILEDGTIKAGLAQRIKEVYENSIASNGDVDVSTKQPDWISDSVSLVGEYEGNPGNPMYMKIAGSSGAASNNVNSSNFNRTQYITTPDGIKPVNRDPTNDSNSWQAALGEGVSADRVNIVENDMPVWIMESLAGEVVKPMPYTFQNDINVSGTALAVDKIKGVHFKNKSNRTIYMLASESDKSLPPLTFQKNNWLKTENVQLKYESGKYRAAWAVLMGFYYTRFGYENILDELTVESKYSKSSMQSGIMNATGDGYECKKRTDPGHENECEYFYWNVFPVEKDSLAAYITTYCYFDQNGAKSPELRHVEYNNQGAVTKQSPYLPNIDAMLVPVNDSGNPSYKPGGAFREYKERLNDPTMKYNELW